MSERNQVFGLVILIWMHKLKSTTRQPRIVKTAVWDKARVENLGSEEPISYMRTRRVKPLTNQSNRQQKEPPEQICRRGSDEMEKGYSWPETMPPNLTPSCGLKFSALTKLSPNKQDCVS